MLELHPKMLKKDGRNQFVILTSEEFEALRQRLLDADDLRALRRARRADKPRTKRLNLAELKKHLARHARPRAVAKRSGQRLAGSKIG